MQNVDFVNFHRAISNPAVLNQISDDLDAIGYSVGTDRYEFDDNIYRAADAWFSWLQEYHPDEATKALNISIAVAQDIDPEFEYIQSGFEMHPEYEYERPIVDDYIGDSYSLGRRNASRSIKRRKKSLRSSRIEPSRFELSEYFRAGIQAEVDALLQDASPNVGYDLKVPFETQQVINQLVEEFAYNLASYVYLDQNSFNSNLRSRRTNSNRKPLSCGHPVPEDDDYDLDIEDYVEEEEDIDDLDVSDQEYSSAETAINGKNGRVPALFNKVNWSSGTINLDYGGGDKFSDAVAKEYFKDKGVTSYIYDKYNQTDKHNRAVLQKIRRAGGADTATLSNVLNVIAEEKERLNVLKNIHRYLKNGGTLYIYSYGGDKKAQSGGARATGKDQWQNFRKSASYANEVRQVFGDDNVRTKGDLIIAVK